MPNELPSEHLVLPLEISINCSQIDLYKNYSFRGKGPFGVGYL